MQLNLSFLDIPAAETHIWETLSNQQKAVVIDAITRILTKTVFANDITNNENIHTPLANTAPVKSTCMPHDTNSATAQEQNHD